MDQSDDDFTALTDGYRYRLGWCYVTRELCESPEHHKQMRSPAFVEWNSDGCYPFLPPRGQE